MMRAATVRVNDTKEPKYLGPSSGIAISRLVMQLAKQFTDSKSIKDIVDERRAAQIKDLYQQEQAKPTSKVYPMISDVAATELPNRSLTDLLVQLYKLKVQPMYPALHEPTLDRDIDAVYARGANGQPPATDYQHFLCRMVVAISLQKMDTQYAGLADSYYLAALQYLERVVKPMDLKTLQCFALMGEYSLLTPTRTAIYYIIGLAVRLAQALGLHEEKTITRGRAGGPISALELDMRRRIFWCILTMDYGLAHSLGRPAMLATRQEHIDVGWFETCDDAYITEAGIDPAAPRPTLKKWVAIHFFKMRLLQLEIRRKLYLRKRAEPKDDSDPWFLHMDAKITAWRDASPSADEGFGLDKVWFIGRYNTMVVFMYRPSPQVPRPSLQAAFRCYEACEYNIHMHRDQINARNVDLTWIFTQSLFMAINTMLWALSYVEVRRRYKREDVERHLEVAMDGITLAAERWPGVASAIQLYSNLIVAILKIYEKDGDIPISAATPSETAASPNSMFPDAYQNRSRTTSPATVSTQSVTTPSERGGAAGAAPPFGFLHQQGRGSIEMPPPVPYQSDPSPPSLPVTTPPAVMPFGQPGLLQQPPQAPSLQQHSSTESVPTLQSFHPQGAFHNANASGIDQQHNHLPTFDVSAPQWPDAANMSLPGQGGATGLEGSWPFELTLYGNGMNSVNGVSGYPAMPNGSADMDPQPYQTSFWALDAGSAGYGTGLTQMQQAELMHSLETDGMEDIQTMISSSLAAIAPKGPPPQVLT